MKKQTKVTGQPDDAASNYKRTTIAGVTIETYEDAERFLTVKLIGYGDTCLTPLEDGTVWTAEALVHELKEVDDLTVSFIRATNKDERHYLPVQNFVHIETWAKVRDFLRSEVQRYQSRLSAHNRKAKKSQDAKKAASLPVVTKQENVAVAPAGGQESGSSEAWPKFKLISASRMESDIIDRDTAAILIGEENVSALERNVNPEISFGESNGRQGVQLYTLKDSLHDHCEAVLEALEMLVNDYGLLDGSEPHDPDSTTGRVRAAIANVRRGHK